MGKVILVCGKICSGKSYYSKTIRKDLNAVIISPDGQRDVDKGTLFMDKGTLFMSIVFRNIFIINIRYRFKIDMSQVD